MASFTAPDAARVARPCVVTGAAGFLGREIARELSLAGHSVAGLDRVAPAGAAVVLAADITNPASLDAAFAKGCEVVVHAAASLEQTAAAVRVNVEGTYNVLAAAKKAGCRKFIFISSVPVIGRPIKTPIDEAHPAAPATLYHTTKLAGELMASLPAFAALRCTVLRVPSPIGPGMQRGRILPAFLDACRQNAPLLIRGGGGRVQTYVDVRDIARAVRLAVDKPEAAGLFLVNGHPVSNLELAKACIRLTGSNASPTPDGVPDPEETLHWVIDGRKASEELDYRPKWTLDQSICHILAAWKEAGAGADRPVL